MTQPKLASKGSGYGGRGYRIPGHTDRYGQQAVYPSVTTVLGMIRKPGIEQWIADETAAYAVTHLPYLVNRTEDVGWRYLRHYWARDSDIEATELRRHWEVVKNDAAELGTNVHEHIEADIDGTIPYPPVRSDEVLEMMGAWEAWYEGHAIVSHATEFTVVDPGFKYAGTGDADWTIACMHDGPGCFGGERGPFRCLVDLKTSRYTWPEHGMQLAALAAAPIRMVEASATTPGAKRHQKTEDGVKITTYWTETKQSEYDRLVLLHIRPDDLDPKGDPIPAFCTIEDRTTDRDVYLDAFHGALMLSHSMRALRNREKSRSGRDIYEGEVIV